MRGAPARSNQRTANARLLGKHSVHLDPEVPSMTVSQRSIRRHGHRRTYTAREDLTCAGCLGPIPAGMSFYRDRTKGAWHKDCKRIGVNARRPVRPRYLNDDPTGQECGGCGLKINADDAVVHKVTVPWHRECAVRR